MIRHPVRFGIQSGQQNVEWDTLRDMWLAAEDWGYDSLWNFDHFYPIFSDPGGPCLEGWTTLSALAQATSRVRIGHLVNGNTYRHPCVTAKMAVSLDHISKGRLNLGLGAGWYEPEHLSFGLDFKTVMGRLGALDEACRIIKGMLREESTTLEGEHYTVRDAIAVPGPVQPGGPPLMIGGQGRRVLLRIVAEHADMWNAAADPTGMKDLIDVIRRHGDAVGRDTDEIEKTVMMPLCFTADRERQDMICSLLAATFEQSPEDARARAMMGTTEECLEKIDAYVRAGVTHFIFMSFAPYVLDEMQAFAEEVMPKARTA